MLYIGCPTTPHWVESIEENTGTKDIPVWSVQTFTSPSSPTSTESNNNKHINVNIQCPTTTTTTTTTTTPDPNMSVQKHIIPKRVAPPPPDSKKKQKKKKMGSKKVVVPDQVEYAVPDQVNSNHWFNRRKKNPKSSYKELDLGQLQPSNPYSVPQVNASREQS